MDFGIPEIVLGIPEISPCLLILINWVIFSEIPRRILPERILPEIWPPVPTARWVPASGDAARIHDNLTAAASAQGAVRYAQLRGRTPSRTIDERT